MKRDEIKTLDDWRDSIQHAARTVDRAPYSHNIVSLGLGAIARHWGFAEANKAIRDFKLARKGWPELPVPTEPCDRCKRVGGAHEDDCFMMKGH